MSKSEIKITSIFVGTAVVLSLLTWLTKPSLSVATAKGMIGQPLFKEFTDALAATSLEIINFDEETGIPATFKVAQVSGLWSIPSHSDYPADAKDRIADVASGLMDLEVLSVVAGTDDDEETAGQNIKDLHEQVGVVDPGQKDLGGATGVGMRVTMQDKTSNDLLALVVGKKVPDRDQLRYVRRVGQDPVYTVKIDTGKLTTKFEDWIEDDLLKLNSWDIKQIHVDEHSIDIIAGRILQGGQVTLEYDDTGDPKWKVLKDQAYQKGKWVDRQLAENEELDTDKLNDLKSAVDDLKIVDVARKPEGLSADLRAGAIQTDHQTAQSLSSRGFYFVEIPSAAGQQRVELRSNEGESSILMKDGVRYVLRFGKVTDVAASGDEEEEEQKEDEKDDDAAAGEDDDESTSSDTGRYLFVMVQFDPSAIEKPEFEELPEAEEPAEAEKTEAEKTDAEKTDAEKTDAEKTEAEKDAEKSEDDAADGDESAEDAEDKEAELAKERERIEKENKRKQDEYDEKIADGEKKVEELNARFADWYYVISDEVYKKIDLGRADMVKEKKKEEEEKEEEEEEETEKETADMTEAPPATPAGPDNPLREFNELKEDAPGPKE